MPTVADVKTRLAAYDLVDEVAIHAGDEEERILARAVHELSAALNDLADIVGTLMR